jgi:DNA polymerase-3 subunit delta'
MNAIFNRLTRRHLESFVKSPSHALGLSGERGTGKGTAARFAGSELLGADIDKIDRHPYVFIRNAASADVGIDVIRELKRFMSLSVPGDNKIKRLVIIENIDNLRHEGQNALLKTIEEPPQDTVILVTFSRSAGVLPTIHSRVQSIRILPLSLKEVTAAYSEKYSLAGITKFFHISGGKAGLFHALLTDDAAHPLFKAIEEAKALLKLTRHERLAKVNLMTKDQGVPPELLLEGLDCLVQANYVSLLKKGTASTVKAAAKRMQYVYEANMDLAENVQPKLVLSRLFLQI